MKKMKRLLAISLGALLICVGISVIFEHGPGEAPRPRGEVQTIHLC